MAQLPVKLGEQVAAGQVLAQLDTQFPAPLPAGGRSQPGSRSRAVGPVPDRGPAAAEATAASQNFGRGPGGPMTNWSPVPAQPIWPQPRPRARRAAQRTSCAGPRGGPQQRRRVGRSSRALAENARASRDPGTGRVAGARSRGIPRWRCCRKAVRCKQATNNYTAALGGLRGRSRGPSDRSGDGRRRRAGPGQIQAALDRLTPRDGGPGSRQRWPRYERQGATGEAARPPSADRAPCCKAAFDAAQAGSDLAAAQLRKAPRWSRRYRGRRDETERRLRGSTPRLARRSCCWPTCQAADPSAGRMELAWRVETTDLTELNVAEVSGGSAGHGDLSMRIPDLELVGWRQGTVKPYGESKQGDIVYAVEYHPRPPGPASALEHDGESHWRRFPGWSCRAASAWSSRMARASRATSCTPSHHPRPPGPAAALEHDGQGQHRVQ